MVLSLNRFRVSLESIFLSDITTADGRYLEDGVFNLDGRGRSSLFKFPREVPTREDWGRWFNFWHSFTATGNKLNVPLGNWVNSTHHIWKWYYRAETDDLLRVEGMTVFHYSPAAGLQFTRSPCYYSVSHKEPFFPGMAVGLPTSVVGLSSDWVTKLSTGPVLASATSVHTAFWEFLRSFGGTWMWEVIEPGKDTPDGVMWIVDGLRNGSLIWATDGSYNRKKAIDLCGVGWMIFCTNTGYRVTGTIWEHFTSASSYRAELLGLCALHLFAHAITAFHKVSGCSALLCCNNKCALEVSSYHAQHIRPSAKCADIRRSLKAVKPLLSGTFHYVHVYGHMDRMLKWEQLTLTQQINCVCDTLAKRSVSAVIANGYHDHPTQFLPREDVALVIWGNKITGASPFIFGFTPARRWHGSTWPCARKITGPPYASKQLIGSILTWPSRTNQRCIGFGG